LLFEKYIQKNIQSIQFENTVIIVLRKFDKKNYLNAKIYRFIGFFDIFEKILEPIV